MDNKITWAMLRKDVSRLSGLNIKETDTAMRAWASGIIEALRGGEDVTINELGTFSIKHTAPRKSVNVVTGEPIILPGSDRLTFTMSTHLRQLINADIAQSPVVHTEPAAERADNDPLVKLGNQADEIVNILADMGQGPLADVTEPVEEEQPEEVVEEPVVEPVEEEQPEEVVEPVEQEQPEEVVEKEEVVEPKKPRLWLVAGMTVVVFLLLFFGIVFFCQRQLEKFFNGLHTTVNENELVAETNDDLPFDLIEADEEAPLSMPMDSTEADSHLTEEDLTEVVAPEVVAPKAQSYRVYKEFITTEEMHQDSRLAWMSYRYYGKKDLWVFIYDANRDHIHNPSVIKVGTPVRIPKLSAEVIALKDPQIVQLVESMRIEFIGK